MSGHHHDQPLIHRGMLIGAAVLLTVTVVGSAWARWSGTGAVDLPDVAMVQMRELRFEDRADGAVVVFEADQQVDVFEAGTGGFVRGVLRALARTRMLGSVGSEAPFQLVHWADGRLTLIDPVTDERVEINAFGPDNFEPFARLMMAPRAVVGIDTDGGAKGRQEDEA
ncbi:MAG TPA: photosynthetic complex assembly protein PuhC [Pseudomonadales bacterium]|nr:photosynthetic complex assembly protein PuhC [Pseudomonadales bacterium]